MYKPKKDTILIISLIIGLFLSLSFSLLLGPGKITLQNILSTLTHKNNEDFSSIILWQIRIPRTLIALFVGMGLSVSGCALQGILRNPLADPYTLGISGGAALGTILGRIFKIEKLGILLNPISSFIGTLISIFLVYIIASKKKFSIITLTLSGIMMSYFCASLVVLLIAMLSQDRLYTTILWLMGDLSSSKIEYALITGITVIFGTFLLILFSQELNILSLGEEKSLSLGMDTIKIKKIIFIIASIITGVSVSFSGMIGFVGFMIPHLIRISVGADHKVLIPLSAIGGGIFLTICDTIARNIISPVELPVGVITGLIGTITFIFLMLNNKKI